MEDAEQAVPPSKKRVAGRELNRDNPGLDDDAPEEETGTFLRASDEVMATRRIVKVRRNPPPSTAPSNPFAGICLVPSTASAAKPNSSATDAPSQSNGDKTVSEEVDSTATSEKNDADKETEKGAGVSESNGSDDSAKKKEPPGEAVSDENSKKDGTDGQLDGSVSDKENKPLVEEPVKDEKDNSKEEEDKENKQLVEEPIKDEKGDAKVAADDEGKVGNASENTSAASAPLSSFQQLSSSQNAFTGLAGTGFSSSSFSFGSIPKDGTAFGGAFGLDKNNTSFPSFGLGSSNNGTSSLQLFGSSASSDATKSERGSLPTMQEVPVETGEENEKSVFTADAAFFEYLDGSWKERGKGELRLNVPTADAGKPRLVMRARGNYRLILNASLYPDMKLTNMDKRGITFACMNSGGSEGKQGGLTTFALKFKDGSIVDEFRGAVMAHKGKKDDGLKTPENSPKASDE
ncbi:hypothetical protein ACLOJK_031832 [Asimina triloba]